MDLRSKFTPRKITTHLVIKQKMLENLPDFIYRGKFFLTMTDYDLCPVCNEKGFKEQLDDHEKSLFGNDRGITWYVCPSCNGIWSVNNTVGE